MGLTTMDTQEKIKGNTWLKKTRKRRKRNAKSTKRGKSKKVRK